MAFGVSFFVLINLILFAIKNGQTLNFGWNTYQFDYTVEICRFS
jgi:hypothetical protein